MAEPPRKLSSERPYDAPLASELDAGTVGHTHPSARTRCRERVATVRRGGRWLGANMPCSLDNSFLCVSKYGSLKEKLLVALTVVAKDPCFQTRLPKSFVVAAFTVR